MNIGALVFISTTMLSGLSVDSAEEHVCIQQKIQMAASVFRTLRVYRSVGTGICRLPDNLSLIPGVYMVGRENDSHMLFSDCHAHVTAWIHTSTH